MEDLHLKVLDRTFELVLNQPWVVNLVLPTSILAGFTVYPSKLEMKYADKEYCKAEWYKAKMVIMLLFCVDICIMYNQNLFSINSLLLEISSWPLGNIVVKVCFILPPMKMSTII